MATLTSNQASAGVQPKGLRVGTATVVATYSPNGSMSSGDVIQMVKVPSGSRVIHVDVQYQLSGVGSFTVGDGISVARYIGSTAGSSGIGIVRLGGGGISYTPYTYSTDDTIDLSLSSSVNVSSGAVYMTAIIEYPGP